MDYSPSKISTYLLLFAAALTTQSALAGEKLSSDSAKPERPNVVILIADDMGFSDIGSFGKPGYEGYLNNSVVSLATVLGDSGYNTYMAGKWHLGDTPESIPHAKGFKRSFALADREEDKPFMVWMGYQAVHYPHQAPKEFIDKYNGVYDKGWEDIRHSRLERQRKLGLVPETAPFGQSAG